MTSLDSDPRVHVSLSETPMKNATWTYRDLTLPEQSKTRGVIFEFFYFTWHHKIWFCLPLIIAAGLVGFSVFWTSMINSLIFRSRFRFRYRAP